MLAHRTRVQAHLVATWRERIVGMPVIIMLCVLADYQHGKQAQKMTDGMNLLGLKTANMPRSVLHLQ